MSRHVEDAKSRELQAMQDQNQVSKAFQLIQEWHTGQLYGDRPYVEHLIEVLKSCEAHLHTTHLTPWKVRVVALLHDLFEDTECPFDTIVEIFGMEIALALLAISKPRSYTKRDYALYITTVCANPLAWFAKVHDTECNLTNSMLEGNHYRIIRYSTQLADLHKGYRPAA